MAAYLRGLPSRGGLQAKLRSPAAVKNVIQSLHRPIYSDGNFGEALIVWNGNVFDKHCLVNKKPFADSGLCPDIDKNLDPYGMGQPTIVFSQGPPSPICSTSCGVLCEGFYCSTNPTGTPPDFPDPGVVISSTFATNNSVSYSSTTTVTATQNTTTWVTTDISTSSGASTTITISATSSG